MATDTQKPLIPIGNGDQSDNNPLNSDGLPDPDAVSHSNVVIYDGECRFCIGQVRNLRRLDCCGGRLSFLSLHDPRVAQRYPDLTHDQLMAEMFVVDQSGNSYGGSSAVRYLSRRLPMLWIAAPILHFPGTAGLWRWGYQQVAKRRYKLAGKKNGSDGKPQCDGDSCAVHFGD